MSKGYIGYQVKVCPVMIERTTIRICTNPSCRSKEWLSANDVLVLLSGVRKTLPSQMTTLSPRSLHKIACLIQASSSFDSTSISEDGEEDMIIVANTYDKD